MLYGEKAGWEKGFTGEGAGGFLINRKLLSRGKQFAFSHVTRAGSRSFRPPLPSETITEFSLYSHCSPEKVFVLRLLIVFT